MFNICFLLVSFLVQDLPKPLPELKPFLAEVRRTLHTDDLLLSQYTYTEKRTQVELDSRQKPKKTDVNVFEVFPGSPERVGYHRLVLKNGAPLTSAESAKEDQRIKKRIETVQGNRGRRPPAELEQARIQRSRKEEQILDDVFGVYEIKIVGRETLADRPAVLLAFTPRNTYKPKTFEGSSMQHVAGRAWIDEKDHQLARIEAEVIEPISVGFGILAKLQKGASITEERRKFNDEIWLPFRTEVLLNARLLLLKGFNLCQIVEYSDHKKYTVDTILTFPQP
jgi:hypothetical protein